MASQHQPFPDGTAWGPTTGRFRAAMIAFAKSPAGSWIIRTLAPLDAAVIRRSRGRYTALGPVGASVALVTTTGRRSGEQRTVPLIYQREDPYLYVVGSNFGQPHHPGWTSNLLADPRCRVTVGGVEVEAEATLLDDAEAARIYTRFAEDVDTYRAYQDRTDREIRVFRLSVV